MHCERALELLPRYADDELTEAQAGPLRRHLMGCPACRAVAADQRGLTRWFEPTEEVAVPTDFAARVAAMAFEGEAAHELTPAAAARRVSPSGAPGPRPLEPAPTGLRDFVLVVIAAAAVAMFALSVAIGMRDRPAEQTLSATELPELLQMLDSLNDDPAGVAQPGAGPDGALPGGGIFLQGANPVR